MNVSVIRFAGTNCEFDTQYAFEKLGANVNIVWHKDTVLPQNTDLVVLAGGFSYGDYLRSGAIARFAPIMTEVSNYAKKGGNVLGICNGFQILTESHLLQGALKRNDNLHFISKFHHLKVENNNNKFLSKCEKDEVLNIPIAHHDGNFFCDNDTLKSLYDNEQILVKYCDKDGNIKNPNGSIDSIAGICNKEKNVFGLMPHPERAMEDMLGSSDGIKMLESFIC
jgi:phosphoribosylformylglycinamidine synthase I